IRPKKRTPRRRPAGSKPLPLSRASAGTPCRNPSSPVGRPSSRSWYSIIKPPTRRASSSGSGAAQEARHVASPTGPILEAAGRRADRLAQHAPQPGPLGPWQQGIGPGAVTQDPEKTAQALLQAQAQGGNRQNLDTVQASIKAQSKGVLANP